mmetsp:Transcript_70134/g.146727  ORF Transcript_70134/g.146727 Transcript_70134/m.146727 type:complete len:260 (+) Transcript_70134:53-832(+)
MTAPAATAATAAAELCPIEAPFCTRRVSRCFEDGGGTLWRRRSSWVLPWPSCNSTVAMPGIRSMRQSEFETRRLNSVKSTGLREASWDRRPWRHEVRCRDWVGDSPCRCCGTWAARATRARCAASLASCDTHAGTEARPQIAKQSVCDVQDRLVSSSLGWWAPAAADEGQSSRGCLASSATRKTKWSERKVWLGGQKWPVSMAEVAELAAAQRDDSNTIPAGRPQLTPSSCAMRLARTATVPKNAQAAGGTAWSPSQEL